MLLRLILAVGVVFGVSPLTALADDRDVVSETTSRDGGPSIYWTLNGPAQGARPILYIGQGSGCAPARSSEAVVTLAALATGYAALTVEKYGVAPDDEARGVGDTSACSDAFRRGHTVSQRVADIEAVLADLKSRKLWNGRLALFGGSEGGAVVSILSGRLEGIDSVAVFSTGVGMTLAEMLPITAPPDAQQGIAVMLDEIRANPDRDGDAFGNSIRWWADIMDRRLSDDLLKGDGPVLLVQGVDDQFAPAAAARKARDAFVAAGEEGRLTYWELADRDHGMVDGEGRSHMQETLGRVAAWIAERRSDE